MPTVYLTNAGTVGQVRRGRGTPESRACVGPGTVWSIMARPRPEYGEMGAGQVWPLVPNESDLLAVKAGTMDFDTYRAAFLDGEPWGPAGPDGGPREPLPRCWSQNLGPGVLAGLHSTARVPLLVTDGDTLVCACGRADAAAGRCHRVWAAQLLHAAGWTVILDGAILANE